MSPIPSPNECNNSSHHVYGIARHVAGGVGVHMFTLHMRKHTCKSELIPPWLVKGGARI